MAAIRDYKITQLTTEAATISVELPTHETNDLLLVLVSKDAAISGSWSVTVATGWTIGGSNSQTANAAIWAWKIAGSSSETNPTIGQSDVDSMIAVALSIRGVNTSTPFHIDPGNGTGSTSATGQPTVTGVTTTNNDCLIIYGLGSDLGVGPTPNPGIQTVVSDDTGTASLGMGWTYQKTAGATGTITFTCANASGTSLPRYEFCWAINDGSSGTIVPAYHDTGTTLATLIEPLTGTTYPISGNTWQATTIDITTIGSKTASYDAIGNIVDSGVNPFHASARITPAASSNLGGTQFNFGSSKDLSSGILLTRTRFATPRDYIDTGFIATGGIQLVFADASNNYRAFMIGAQRDNTTNPADANLHAIQVGQSTNTRFATSTTDVTLTAITKFLFLETNPLGAGALDISQMVNINKAVIAGGSSTNPIDYAGFLSVINGYILDFAKIQGTSESLIFCPVQIGGSLAVHLDMTNFAIEFPQRASQTTGYLNFHVDENIVGFIFDGRSGDTVKMTNGIIASASKYKFEFLSSVSTSATWDFSGLTVIGATPTLRNIGTTGGFQLMSFIDCDQIVQNSATLDNCTISDTIHATAALLSNNPALIKNCAFISGGTKHAIEINTAGTYTFSGNTFSGYGANGTTDAAIYNNSSGSVTLNITNEGNTPTVRNGAGASTTINNSVTLTVAVKDESGGNVESARVAIYKTSDMTELMNTTTNASGVATTTYNYISDTAVIIRVRKSSATPKYVAVQTSGTITTTGLTTTVTFVADSIAASSFTAQIATDFSVNTTTKTIRHTTGSTVYTVNDLYTWLMDYFDADTLMDDTIPMTAQTPSEYTFINSWFIDKTSTKYLKSGAIQTSGQASYNIHILTVTGGTYNDPVSGDITKTVVAGATSIGPLLDYEIISAGVSSKWYVRDTRGTPAQIASGTSITITSGTGSGNNSTNSSTGENIFSNIFTLGTLVSGTTLDVYQDDSQIIPWWSSGHIDILVKVKEANVEIDSGNLTILARKYGTLYDHYVVDASTGRTPVPLAAFDDGNNDTSEGGFGGTPYTNMSITFGTVSADVDGTGGNEPYDVSVDGATGTIQQIYEYLKYVTRTGSSTTLNGANGEYYQAVGDIRLTYTTGSGTISQGNTITDTTSGATGYITSKIDASNTLVVTRVHGTFSNGDSISSSGATGTINSVPESITQSKQAPFGTFAGGKFFGARGVYVHNMAPGDANNYQLIDSTNTTRTPPVTVSTVITVQDLSTGLPIENATVLVWVTNNANYFYQASVSITGSGTTATVSHTAHGMITGDYVIIEGVTNDDDYNGVFEITKINDNSYSYTTTETLDISPATGTITATFALISGTTNASGQVSDIRSLASNQPISGWARKSSSSPYYQQGTISGTVSSSNGFSVTIQLARDE